MESFDAFDYGYGAIRNFHARPGLLEGVAMLTRTVFLESCGRYVRLFSEMPLTKFAQFVERVPMVNGRLDPKASTATGSAWLVGEKDNTGTLTQLIWVPPCRKRWNGTANTSKNRVRWRTLGPGS